MFNSPLVESKSEKVTLHDVDPDALDTLVNFMYVGRVTVTEDNVQALLPASCLMQIELVKKLCSEFLMQHLKPNNCLGIRGFADVHNCVELRKRAHLYVQNNFREVVKTEEFLSLSIREVEELVCSNCLNVPAEEEVLSAVMAWVQHEPITRGRHLSKLLKHVRLGLVPRQYLFSILDGRSIVVQDAECTSQLLEAMRYHLMPEQRVEQDEGLLIRERQPEGLLPYVFAVGGSSLFAIHCDGECYDPRRDKWATISPMAHRRTRLATAALGRRLYVLGGSDGGTDLDSVEYYDPNANVWCSAPGMGTRRSGLGACTLRGLLYVLGGWDGASCLDSCQWLDPLYGLWVSAPTMLTRRRNCSAAALDNCVWVVGGRDGTSYLGSCEWLDPREGKWRGGPPVSGGRRSACGLVPHQGFLYCWGGTDGTTATAMGERYNPRRNQWESVAPMLNKRCMHAMVSVGEYLYAIGGNEGGTSLSVVERYDPRRNTWHQVQSMTSRRSSVSVVVLPTPNMADILNFSCK